MLSNSKYDLDYLDSLPLRESSTTYLKYNSTTYCDYKKSKLIHFNNSYSKFENKLQRACIKFIGKSVENLAKYLLNIETKNKFYIEAINFIYNCIYNRNAYYNELEFVDIKDGIVVSKTKLSRKRKVKNIWKETNTKPYKFNYTLSDGTKLIYRFNCYFYLIEDKNYYNMDYKGNTVFIPSKYLQLNKKELKLFNISNYA